GDDRRRRHGRAAGRRRDRRARRPRRAAGARRRVRRVLAAPAAPRPGGRRGGRHRFPHDPRRRTAMIRLLLRVLGPGYAPAMRRTVALMGAAAAAEGLSYALLVPTLRALLGGAPGDAWPWLIGFGAAVAGYGVLRYAADLRGMRVGTTMLRGMYRGL